MSFQELFQEAARLSEPPVPGDILVRVAAARRQRRWGIALLAVPAVVVIALGAAALPQLSRSDSAPAPSASLLPDPNSVPKTLVVITGGRGSVIDLTTGKSVQSFGPTRQLTVAPTGLVLLAPDSQRACMSSLRWSRLENSTATLPAPFDPQGYVTSLDLSPDGTRLAYGLIPSGRFGMDPGFNYCQAPADLVVRDLATGLEQRWPASDRTPTGTITALSWSPNGQYLAVQTGAGAVPSMRTVTVTSPPGPLGQQPSTAPARPVGQAPDNCTESLPTYYGQQQKLLVYEVCQPAGAQPTYRLLDAGTGQRLATLPSPPARISSSRDGSHLLVTTLDSFGRPKPVIAYNTSDGSRATIYRPASYAFYAS